MTLWITLLCALLGLILGSFLSMLIPRLHYGESGIVKGRSRCPHCKKNLAPRDLVPLFSYLALRGRCRQCKKPISAWYPIIEVTSALTFGFLFHYLQDGGLFLWFLPHFFVLLFIFFYDLRFKEIHDAVMIPGILYALFANFYITDPVNGLIGAAIGFSFFGLQWALSRGRWIGSGDIRIGTFMGLLLGWPMTLLAILISYLLGSVVSIYLLATKKASAKTAVPLGPFLVVGTVLGFFFGDTILDIYLSIL